jgi:hypothetical protein
LNSGEKGACAGFFFNNNFAGASTACERKLLATLTHDESKEGFKFDFSFPNAPRP